MASTGLTYKRLLYSQEEVQLKINQLAQKIIRTYKNERPLFVCMLRGGAPFAAKLMAAITAQESSFHPELDYMTVRTYGDKRSAKPPELIMQLSPKTNVSGRPVIIIDDVWDTGETAVFTSKYLIEKSAKSVDLCILVNKDVQRPKFDGNVLYGFDAPAEWLTGMGLDDARIAPEANRWAPYIAIAN